MQILLSSLLPSDIHIYLKLDALMNLISAVQSLFSVDAVVVFVPGRRCLHLFA